MPITPRSILKRLQTEATPLLDGDGVVFVWQGKEAPRLASDLTGWDDGPQVKMEQVSPGLWIHRQSLPQDAYIEYAFMDGEDHIPDPHNPRRVFNGLGDHNNYFYMPAAAPSPLIKRQRGARRGTLKSLDLPTYHILPGKRRRVHLYQPPGEGPFPLMVVWDGQDYLRRGRLITILENLAAQQRVRPPALLMVENHSAARMAEYACSEASLIFLQYAALPAARSELPLVDPDGSPGAWGVLGASMGGLMALFTALRMPKWFGRVLSQSGGFGLGEFDSVIFDLVTHHIGPQPIVWMDIGVYDYPRLLEANRLMLAHLQSHGFQAGYHEYTGGHNYNSWRDDLWRGLEYLYG